MIEVLRDPTAVEASDAEVRRRLLEFIGRGAVRSKFIAEEVAGEHHTGARRRWCTNWSWRHDLRLVYEPDAVAVLAARGTDDVGLPAAQVEKDFWVAEVLRGAMRSAGELGVEIVFKGGTSLSKAYRPIERFSEDVDVLVLLPPQETGSSEPQP